MLDAVASQDLGQLGVLAGVAECRVGFDHLYLALEDLYVAVFENQIRMVLSSFCALDAVSWPHDLISSGLLHDNLREQLLSRMTLHKADMVFRVPISATNYHVEEVRIPQMIDQAEYLEGAGHGKAASRIAALAEVVLHVDDDQSCLVRQGVVQIQIPV